MVRYDCYMTGEGRNGYYFRNGKTIGCWDHVDDWEEEIAKEGKCNVYKYSIQIDEIEGLEDLYQDHLLFSSELFVWEDE